VRKVLTAVTLTLFLLSQSFSCRKKVNEGGQISSHDEFVDPDVYGLLAKMWRSDELTRDDYLVISYKMLKYAETTEIRWLTLGNVVKSLGAPDFLRAEFGYTFDKDGNVMADVTCFQIAYERTGVLIGFGATGLVISVLARVSPEKESGLGSSSWPQQIPDEVRAPILSGHFESADPPTELIETAMSMTQGRRSEIEWYRMIVGHDFPVTDMHYKTYGHPCRARVVLVDGVGDGVAMVLYRTSGRHTLYYQSWWLRDADGQWKKVPAGDAHETLNRLWAAEQQ